MASLGRATLHVYSAVVKLPVIGAIARLPVRGVRAVMRPIIQEDIRAILTGSPPAATGFTAGPSDVTVGALWDATASLQSQIQGLWQRVDFVRAETMFEMRALMKGGNREAGYKQDAVARIKDKAKVDAAIAAGRLRLNVGCGHIPVSEYVNVDGRDLPGVDVVSDASELPFEAGSVYEVFSSHLLEHFPLEHCRRVLLPHWRDLLQPGGMLRAIVPDAEGMIVDYVSGVMSFDDLREVTYGLQEYDGDFHFNMFSREMLKNMVREGGFAEVEYEFVNRKNGKCRDMAIRAVRL